jgi:hypothetical protein
MSVMVKEKTYPIAILMGLAHVWSAVLFYYAAVNTWTPRFVQILFIWLRRVLIVLMGYCLLQLVNLDQFYKQLDNQQSADVLVGTVGNSSQLAAQLSFGLPILLEDERLRFRLASLLCVALILFTGSLAAYLGTAAVLLAWSFRYSKRLFGIGMIILASGIAYLCWHPALLDNNGRWEAWSAFYKFFKFKPILGFGPGFIYHNSNSMTAASPIFQWRHVHNEYFQVAIELGVIGLGILLWMLKDAFGRVFRTRQTFFLGLILLSFCLNSLLNFPAHIWQLSMFGLIAYCGLYLETNRAHP